MNRDLIAGDLQCLSQTMMVCKDNAGRTGSSSQVSSSSDTDLNISNNTPRVNRKDQLYNQ